MPSIAELKEWLPLLNFVGPILFAALLSHLRRVFVTKDDHAAATKGIKESLSAMELRLQTHSERLNRGEAKFEAIDTRMRNMPTSEQVANLRVAMAELVGKIDVVAERAEGLEDQLKATNRHLLILDEYVRGMKS